jgi:hypothetical protein
MQTVYVLTVIFLIQKGQPYTATFGEAYKTMAACKSEQVRGLALVKQHRFRLLESGCRKMQLSPVNGKFEVGPGRWVTLQ